MKHEETNFSDEFIFAFILYFIGVISSKKRWGFRKKRTGKREQEGGVDI